MDMRGARGGDHGRQDMASDIGRAAGALRGKGPEGITGPRAAGMRCAPRLRDQGQRAERKGLRDG